MINLRLCFYEELNDFLSIEKRNRCFYYSASTNATIKDIIESLGVPHTEIDLILVNKNSVNFTYKVHDGDDISVYPVLKLINNRGMIHLRPEPLREIHFILDVHLGKLARYLRLLGLDAAYDNYLSDETIATRSEYEKRIVLTRDVGLLKNKKILHGYWVRQINPEKQVKEVLKRFDLYHLCNPLTRCMECNGLLEEVNKDDVATDLLPLTLKYYLNFMRCTQCKKIYWEGTHYQRLKKRVDEFLSTD